MKRLGILLLLLVSAVPVQAQTILLAQKSVSLNGLTDTGRLVSPKVTIDPLTSTLEVRLRRPTTLTPLPWASTARIRISIVLTVDAQEYRCTGEFSGGIRLDPKGKEIAESVLTWTPPWGFFGAREGLTKRLGETAKSSYTAHLEVTLLSGSLATEVGFSSVAQAAPQILFHSSVAFDAGSSAQEVSGDGILSVSHTSGGTDRAVFVSNLNFWDWPAGRTSTSVTYGGAAMDAEMWDFQWNNGGTGGGNAGYRLVNQATGAQTVTGTLVGAPTIQMLGVISMTGVHQTPASSVGTPVTASGGATPATATVGSVGADDLVVEGSFSDFNGTITIGADQIQQWIQDETATYGIHGRGSTQPGTAGGVMSWTLGGSSGQGMGWGLGAVAFKPAPAGGARRRNALVVTQGNKLAKENRGDR